MARYARLFLFYRQVYGNYMAMFDNSSALAEQMRIELAKTECELEDGSMVSNLEGICQKLIGRAMDGDLTVIQLIADLADGKIRGKK